MSLRKQKGKGIWLSKKQQQEEKELDLGLSFRQFKFGIILGSIATIFYFIISIIGTWYDSVYIDVIFTIIYFCFLIAAITVVIDYLFVDAERKAAKKRRKSRKKE